jgi:hypothetical protein
VRYVGRDAAGGEQVRVVGFPADLELVESLVTSLLVQLSGAMLRAQPPARSASASAAWRRSFISGFVGSVTDRLEAQRAEVVVDVTASTGASVALVLADRDARVEADFRRRHPRVRLSRVSAGSSGHGHRAGADAGRVADLGGRRLGARRTLPA